MTTASESAAKGSVPEDRPTDLENPLFARTRRHDDSPAAKNVESDRRRVQILVLQELRSIRGLGDLTSRYRLDLHGSRARTTLTLLTAQFGTRPTDQVIRAAEVIELEHLAVWSASTKQSSLDPGVDLVERGSPTVCLPRWGG